MSTHSRSAVLAQCVEDAYGKSLAHTGGNQHRAVQERERDDARQLWHEGGWVFTTPVGRPVNPNTDYHQWKALLREAGLRDARLHDARHTAATVLLILGVPERAVMGLMGWSHSGMAARYQHITSRVQRDVAQRIGGLLWKHGYVGAGELCRTCGQPRSAPVHLNAPPGGAGEAPPEGN